MSKPTNLQELRQYVLCQYINMKRALPMNEGRKHIIIVFTICDKNTPIDYGFDEFRKVETDEHIRWNGEPHEPTITDVIQTAAFMQWASMTSQQWVQDYLGKHGKAPE